WRWFGACSGFYIGEATPEQRSQNTREALQCNVVEPLLQHIERRLCEKGIIDPQSGKILVDPARLLGPDDGFIYH
ncbi:MAG: hypothetical protein ACKOZT_13865, partial [Cyanobium sp.]